MRVPAARKTSRRFGGRRLVFGLAAAAASAILTLLVIESGLRLSGYDPIGEFTQGSSYFLRISDHPDRDYELVPNTRGDVWECRVEINSIGIRDREYTRKKPPGTRRLIVLGDSITFGNGMDILDTYPKRLEQLYAKDQRPIEVLNFGVGGYDLLNEVGFFEQVGIGLDPDVVVVGYCINDIGMESLNLTFVLFLQEYGDLIRHSRLLQYLTVTIDRSLASTDFLYLNSEEGFRRWNENRIASIQDDAELLTRMHRLETYVTDHGFISSYPYLDWYRSESKIGKLRYALRKLGALAGKHGIPVIVALIPMLDQEGHGEAYRLAFDIVRHEVLNAGLMAIEIEEAFAGYEIVKIAQTKDGRPDRIHPNESGHAIIARHLYEELPHLIPEVFGDE